MALRLLIDVNVGKIVEDWLKTSGFDVITVRDIDPSLADNLILDRGLLANRLVVTMDKDFGELVYRLGLGHSGVLLLRLEADTSQEKIKALDTILRTYPDQLQDNFCVYQRGRLRVRGR